MEIVFIRHGEPDYKPCWERGFVGHGKDLACLTPEGINQAKEVSRNPILNGSELIISSPYTRALQTAALPEGSQGLQKLIIALHMLFILIKILLDLTGFKL